MEVSNLAVVGNLTNLADVNRLLHEINARERSIEGILEGLQANRSAKEAELSHLHASSQELLEVALSDAEGLASSVHETSSLSERVSKKVRELDLVQSRAQESVARINRLVSRTKAISGVQQAIAADDYERAAGYVAEHLELQQEFASEAPREIQASDQEKVLQNAREELLVKVRQQLETASRDGKASDVMRFVALFGPLGAKEEGTTWLVNHLKDAIQRQANAAYTALVESSDAEADFVGALTDLLRSIGTAVQEHEEMVSTSFGKEMAWQMLDGLHQQCDASAGRLVQRFIKQRNLDRCVADIRSHRASLHNQQLQQASSPALDPRQLEGKLEEILVLCQRAEEYNQFMLAKAAEAAKPKLLPTSHENAFRSGAFNTSIRELSSYYINMEEFYIEQSVEKGIEIDSWRANSLASSMVDDIFFVLQKCAQRGLATRNLQCVGAIMGQVNTALATSLRAALDSRWKGGCAILLQGLSASLVSEGTIPGDGEGAAAAALNNADLSARYATKLGEQVALMASDVFPAAHDRERVHSVLADLAKTAAEFREVANKAVHHLASGALLQLRGAFEEVDACSYELSEAEYAGSEADYSWVDRMLNTLAATFQWLQTLLTPGNYDALVPSLLEKVVDRLEASMNLKRFNQLGGLQLDRNVRIIVSTLSEVTQRTVRDKFAKLSQMSTLLSLESAGEVLEYWGESSDFNWCFTESQVKAILGQRVDFDARDISMLAF